MADQNDSETIPKSFSPFLRQLYVVSGIVMNTIGGGCIIGYPAVLLPQLARPDSSITLTPSSESWVASILGFAMLNGIILAPIIMDVCGRRLTNLLSVLPALAGWGFFLIADNVTVLILARYCQGVAMGFQGTLAPVSIGEYSSPVNRGGFLGTIALSIASGMLFCHACGSFLTWKNTALASMSFSVISLLVISTSPETPAWLASKGKYDKCRAKFFWLRGYGINDREELDIMINKQIIQRKMNRNTSKVTLKIWSKEQITIMKKREFYKPSLIMMTLFVLMQFSGANVIPTYSVSIMKVVTSGTVSPYTGMLVLDFVRFIAAVISCFALRVFNRRSVLFFSSTVSTVSLLVTSGYLYGRDNGHINLSHNWIPISFLVIYVMAIVSGIYTLPFGILGEVYPTAYKSLGSCISGIILSTTFFVVIKSAPYMFLFIGVHGTFLVFAIIIVICTAVLYVILPETKGKTLQQIEDYFNDKSLTNISVSKDEENKIVAIESIESCL